MKWTQSNGGVIKENWNNVQKKGKQSKVEYRDENVTWSVQSVDEEQLIELTILRNP